MKLYTDFMNWIDDYFSANELITIAKLRNDIKLKDKEVTRVCLLNIQQAIIIKKLKEDNALKEDAQLKLLHDLEELKEFRMGKDDVSMIQPLYVKSDLKASQSNKPSSASSLEYEDTVTKLKQIFPYPKFRMTRVANTNSMEPFIDYNSLIVYEKLTATILKKQPLVKGDICLYNTIFNSKKAEFIHRIIDINREGNQFKFKGDNNFNDDGWIDQDRITYRYIGQIQLKREHDND